MPRSPRSFTIGDALILIAAIAFGFATARVCLTQLMPGTQLPFAVRMTAIFVALSLTITVIPMRFRRPRPRRPCRYPGTMAGFAVAMALAFIFVEQASSWFLPLPKQAMAEPSYQAMNLVFNVVRLDMYSLAVAGAWLSLYLSGRWHAERDWLDRAGRLLGVCWIVSPFVAGWIDQLVSK